MELLAARLILAVLQDDPCEREFRIRQVREESGLDLGRFLLALATAEEAASWWGSSPDARDLARARVESSIIGIAGVPA